MLKTNQMARDYFHRRYKVLYVDEMQDTDPVQTELLFYLTADKDHFNGTDWKLCRPVPGSLFLVGDPKQTIYRFRGADIGVYNDLLTLFREKGTDADAVGEKVTLRYNYRSSREICALADQVFAPDANDPRPYHFTGGKYHAEYVSMGARNGSCSRSRTVFYAPGFCPEDDDPSRVAAFIRTMIDHKKQVGIYNPKLNRYPHAAEAKDFLVLTQRKGEVQRYADALKAQGIAVEVTGEKCFREVPPVARAALHLRSLLSQRDDRLALLVLKACYGIREDSVRVFLQRTTDPAKGWRPSLTRMVDTALLAGIRQALEAETPRDEASLAVCGALEEMARLRMLARTKPAMTVVEVLLESGGYGVWQGLEKADLAQRQQTYSEVRQYLNLVRGAAERSFTALAEYAVACADQSYEQELTLEPAANAVRVMNLHKAKGLEGEIVILANSWQYQIPPAKHVERGNGPVREHVVLREKSHRFGNTYDVALPEGWAANMQEEQNYLQAEYARQLYVAATRAKSMLVICDREPYDAEQAWKTSYWEPLLDGREMEGPDEEDPDFSEAFQALNTGDVVPVQSPASGQTASSVAVQVDPEALEAALCAGGTALAESIVYAITPSGLDAHPAEELPVQHTGEAEGTDPYGTDWGTIVHRTMELAVRDGSYTPETLWDFARQAAAELLPGGAVSQDQCKALRLEENLSGPEIIERLARQAAEKTAFLCDRNSSLRRLLDGGECYPELPFFLQVGEEDESASALYQHLSAHISIEKAKGRTLAVEGIIDLAVYKDGGWYVVDYKTDRQRKNESIEDFTARLKGEYTPQITAYARVLERMGMGNVKQAWLCSIPLDGQLIPLDI